MLEQNRAARWVYLTGCPKGSLNRFHSQLHTMSVPVSSAYRFKTVDTVLKLINYSIMKGKTMKSISNFLNEDGKIKAWPAKRAMQHEILAYLAESFTPGRSYTELEVNEIIGQKHTFGDLFLLRRGLVDEGFVKRATNGSAYWREKEEKD